MSTCDPIFRLQQDVDALDTRVDVIEAMPTTDFLFSEYIQPLIDNYLSVAATVNVTGGITTTVAYEASHYGKLVTVQYARVTGTFTNTVVTYAAIPAAFRPARAIDHVITMSDGAVLKHAQAIINTNGTVTIDLSAYFVYTPGAGFISAFSMTFVTA